MSEIVKVKYSCHGCGVRGREVDAPARGEEDAVAWIDGKVRPAIAADHAEISPHCRCEVCDLMIPVSSAGKVGSAIRH